MKPIGEAAAAVAKKLELSMTTEKTELDDHAVWHAMLRGEKPEIHPDDPQCGCFRVRKVKGGEFYPLRYFKVGGTLYGLLNGEAISEDRGQELWQWAAANPITYEAYEAAVAGRGWSDIDPVVAEQQRSGIGGNNPPDEYTLLQEQIESASAGASAYSKITDDATQAKAQTLRSRLLELSRLAENKREALKRPHIEAGREIDEKWQPLVRGAKAIADTVAKAMSAFETEKLRKEREEQRKREEAAAKAEAERRAHEEAARKAAAANEPAPPAPEPAPPVEPAPPPRAPAPIKGAAGRAASVKLVKVVTVTDQDAVYAYMRERPEVAELLAKLAQRAVDAGREVPGTTVEEQRRVA